MKAERDEEAAEEKLGKLAEKKLAEVDSWGLGKEHVFIAWKYTVKQQVLM